MSVTEQLEAEPADDERVQLSVAKSVLKVTVPVGAFECPETFTVAVHNVGWFTSTLFGLQFKLMEDGTRETETVVVPELVE